MVGVGKSFPQADALYTAESEQEYNMPWDRCLAGDGYNLAALDREEFSIPEAIQMILIS